MQRAETTTPAKPVPESFALSASRFAYTTSAHDRCPKAVSSSFRSSNEARTLEEILRRVRAADVSGLTQEIISVNDGSTDVTGDIMEKLTGAKDLKIFSHPHNRGKGAAIRTAIEHATGDVLLIQDADLEYDPSDYPLLLKQSLMPSRRRITARASSAAPTVYFFLAYMANPFLTLLSNCSAI